MDSARNAAAAVLETNGQQEDREATSRRARGPLVLVIEPDPGTRLRLNEALRASGLRVIEAVTGLQGLALAAGHNPDVVLVGDAQPSEVDGVAVTQRLRAWTEAPVLFVSARDDERGKVAALDAGANDYVTKPFATGELLARIRVWLRHTQRARVDLPGSVLDVGALRVDLAKGLAFVNDAEVHFTPIEFKLLTFFCRNAGTVLTHERILVTVWGRAYAREIQYLRVFVGQLRQKIEDEPAHPRRIVTEPGVGYRLREDE